MFFWNLIKFAHKMNGSAEEELKNDVGFVAESARICSGFVVGRGGRKGKLLKQTRYTQNLREFMGTRRCFPFLFSLSKMKVHLWNECASNEGVLLYEVTWKANSNEGFSCFVRKSTSHSCYPARRREYNGITERSVRRWEKRVSKWIHPYEIDNDVHVWTTRW